MKACQFVAMQSQKLKKDDDTYQIPTYSEPLLLLSTKVGKRTNL